MIRVPWSLVLQMMTVVLSGLILWKLKGGLEEYRSRGDSVEHLERAVDGAENSSFDGLVNIAELHDEQIEKARKEREVLSERQRIAEIRLERVAEKANIRNGLSDIQQELREEHDIGGDDFESPTD